MIVEHPSFKHPTNPSIRLWRYMDLSKFISLVQQEKLYFARADKLGDPFEGSMPKLNAAFWPYVIANRYNDPALSDWAQWSDKEILHIADRTSVRRKEARELMYVNCWHMNEHESAAMWRLYGQSNEAISIQTTFVALAAALPSAVYAGTVEYIDYDTSGIAADNLFNAFLIKRKSYEHERELRAMVLQFGEDYGPHAHGVFSDGGFKVPVDLNVFVHAIFVSPTSPEWFRSVVEGIARQYGVTAPVQQSGLLADPLY